MEKGRGRGHCLSIFISPFSILCHPISDFQFPISNFHFPSSILHYLFSTLYLYLHTARHLRPSQIIARLALYAKQCTLHRWPWFLAWRYGVGKCQLSLASRPLLPYDRALLAQVLWGSSYWEQVEVRFVDLMANRFSFLNRTVTFGKRICWDPPGESRLWRYNLHYFDYTWDLIFADALREDDAAYRCFRRLVEDWIAHNPIVQGVGWHAYPVALRVVNWIYAAVAFQRYLARDSHFRQRFLTSLYTQCRFLADHLERDSRGNHLLKDGKALLTAGLFFRGAEAEQWFQRGAQIIWQALGEQILPDGGHYERSPMYHAIVLQDYLEILALYHARGLPLPDGVEAKLRAMVDFFVGLRHPDGDIPLFGDAAFGIARGPEELLPLAAVLLNESRYRWPQHTFSPLAAFLLGDEGARAFAALRPPSSALHPPSSAFPHSGYFVFGDRQGNALILDGGEIGPDEVPAHGHCNTFGYELSVNGRRVIVDSGVETYEPGPWRDYYRSTRAHNTLMVDEIEQSETWAAFRVARHARVRDVRWEVRPDLAWFEGTHEGFAREVPGLRHRRLVVHVPGVFWLIADRVWGADGQHQVESFVHLHPDVVSVTREDAVAASIPIHVSDGDVLLYLIPFGFSQVHLLNGEQTPIQGWYAPEFGRRVPNSVLVLSHQVGLPDLCGYVLMLPLLGSPSVRVIQTEAGELYTVTTEQRTYRLTCTREGVTLSME